MLLSIFLRFIFPPTMFLHFIGLRKILISLASEGFFLCSLGPGVYMDGLTTYLLLLCAAFFSQALVRVRRRNAKECRLEDN